MGDAGKILLSVIVALACVTTAVALVSSAADFFSRLLKNRISNRALLVIDCVIGALICDIGLDNIIRFADPVLGVVYPPFITVVMLLIFRKQIKLLVIWPEPMRQLFLADDQWHAVMNGRYICICISCYHGKGISLPRAADKDNFLSRTEIHIGV